MPASPIKTQYPSQHYLTPDRRLGDRRPSQSVARAGNDATLPRNPTNVAGETPPRTTKSGHHLSSYKRTHYGGHYLQGGGRGPGGPRHGDPDASVKSCSSTRSRSSMGSSKKAVLRESSKVTGGPKQGFARTHDGGFWGYSRSATESSLAESGSFSARSHTSSDLRSSHRRFPRSKTTLNVRHDELDRIKGYARKENGGYWRDREHQDPGVRPATARPADANTWTPRGEKTWTPRSAYFRKKLGEFYRPEPHDVTRKGASLGGSEMYPDTTVPALDIFDDKAADPQKPKPGYTRTYWGSYYRDPDKGIDESARRTFQSSVPPKSGFSRTPMGGFFRGKTYEQPGPQEPLAHEEFALPANQDKKADPSAPGPGYTRTNYGGYYMKEKQFCM